MGRQSSAAPLCNTQVFWGARDIYTHTAFQAQPTCDFSSKWQNTPKAHREYSQPDDPAECGKAANIFVLQFLQEFSSGKDMYFFMSRQRPQIMQAVSEIHTNTPWTLKCIWSWERSICILQESLKISMSGKDILLSATLALMLLCHAPLQSRAYSTLRAQAEEP